MDKPDLNRFRKTEEVIRRSCETLRSAEFPYASLIRDRYQYEYILLMAQIAQVAPEERKKFKQIFSQWKSVLQDSADPMVRYARVALYISGTSLVGYMLHALKLIHHYKLERRLKK